MTKIPIFLVGLCLLATCQVKAYYLEKDPQEVINYIESLDIAPQTVIRLDSGTNASVVHCESIVLDPNVPDQSQQDIKNALLLGLLAAQKQFPDPKDAVQFFSTLKTTLLKIGLVLMTEYSWSNIDTSAQGFTVGNEIVAYLAGFLVDSQLTLVSDLLAGLKTQQESDSPAWQVFSSVSKTTTDARFGIGAVIFDGTFTNLVFSASSMHASEISDPFLWSTWESTPLTLQLAGCKMALDETIYAVVREAVIQKLGNYTTTYIKDFDI
jgi:hypothetical protein